VKFVPVILILLLAACGESAPTQVVNYPEPGSPALANFQKQCSACHAPPRPTVHTAVEWPSVIARMQQHRMEHRMAPVQAVQLTMLRDYLIRNAGKGQR